MFKVTIIGDKALISGLNEFGDGLDAALGRGLDRIGAGIFRAAYEWLSGPGSKASRKKGVEVSAAGSYPIPVVSGHLRQLLDWLHPGESKSGEAGTYTAGRNEIVVFDSAAYHAPIFLGEGSSAKFGSRNALVDGLNQFNQGDQIEHILEEEIKVDIDKRGLA
jgi:hypothetical protein